MKIQAFVIRDAKVEAYHRPFFSHNEMEMRRMITDTAEDGSSTFAKYPQDFDVFHIGEYNDETGQMEFIEKKHCGNVLDIIVIEKKEREKAEELKRRIKQ